VDAFTLALSRALRDYMTDTGVTQEQVAKLLDRSQGYVSHRTTGKQALSTDIIDAVAVLSSTSQRALMTTLVERATRDQDAGNTTAG
jgi:transcriptional regulator with XRE-family HTH domain